MAGACYEAVPLDIETAGPAQSSSQTATRSCNAPAAAWVVLMAGLVVLTAGWAG